LSFFTYRNLLPLADPSKEAKNGRRIGAWYPLDELPTQGRTYFVGGARRRTHNTVTHREHGPIAGARQFRVIVAIGTYWISFLLLTEISLSKLSEWFDVGM
jgi:hypothetical protein